MAKPIIAIPGYKSESGVFGVGSNYLEWVSKFGNPRIILPWEEKVPCDLLLLPGGPDLNPTAYGAVPEFKTGETCPFRQHFFDKRLDAYVGKVPIFGICLGGQMLNVKLGGKLTQDLPFHPHSSDRWEEGHDISLSREGIAILNKKLVDEKTGKSSMQDIITVNSHHHQGILKGQIADELTHLAAYVEEGEDFVLESAIHKEKKIAFVQWHPEEFYDEFSTKLIQHLLK